MLLMHNSLILHIKYQLHNIAVTHCSALKLGRLCNTVQTKYDHKMCAIHNFLIQGLKNFIHFEHFKVIAEARLLN